jgi:hypothetical protein
MLSVRVALGSRPAVQARRLLVAGASAGTGFLMLAALGYGLGHPERSAGGTVRLAWCVVPFVLTVYLAVTVARTEPASGWLHAGLRAAGLGPTRLPALAAVSTALNCALGSTVALLIFLYLRGDIAGSPFDGAVAELLGGREPLPVGGTLVLLAALPAAGAAAAAFGVPTTEGGDQDMTSAATAPGGLSWGVALTGIGLAVAVAGASGRRLALPGGLAQLAPGVLAGWLVAAAGMVVAGPGVVHACGRLLAAYRPGALRLLAGRALQEEAARIGHPLGALCAVACAGYAGAELYGRRPMGPLTGLALGVVLVCAVATVLNAVLEARWARRRTTDTLRRLGTPARLLRGAVALRAAVLIGAVAPATCLIAALAVLPLGG